MTTLLIEPEKQKHPSHKILLHEPSGTLFGAVNFNSQQIENCIEVNRESLTVSAYAHVELDYAGSYSLFYVQDLRELPLVQRMLSNEFSSGETRIIVTPEYLEKIVGGPY